MTFQIYRNENGDLYKAEKAKNAADSLLPNTTEMLQDLLTEKPMSQTMVDSQIIKANNCLDTLDSMGLDPESAEGKIVISQEMGVVLPVTEAQNTLPL